MIMLRCAAALLLLPTVVLTVPGAATAQVEPVLQRTGPANLPCAPTPLSLADLIRQSIDAHPRLKRAAFAIEAAQGRAQQAGLYPNPTVSIQGEEMGSRLGPGGVITAPLVSQEI